MLNDILGLRLKWFKANFLNTNHYILIEKIRLASKMCVSEEAIKNILLDYKSYITKAGEKT